MYLMMGVARGEVGFLHGHCRMLVDGDLNLLYFGFRLMSVELRTLSIPDDYCLSLLLCFCWVFRVSRELSEAMCSIHLTLRPEKY